MIKNILNKYFNIHKGEYKIALLMQFYIFLIITVLLLVKPTVSALFINHLGAEKLPYGFLLVAVIAILSSVYYNRMVKKFSIKYVAIVTVILFSSIFFGLSYLIRQGEMANWMYYFYYVSLSLFGVMVTSQFWVIANLVFNIREAKRLFGFIGAGAIAGGILGGYLTSVIANLFGTEIVILIAASLLLLCLPVIFWVWKLRVTRLNKYIKKKRSKSEKALSGNSFAIVLKSKHLINISAIVGVSVLVAKLIDYQFSYMSHLAYPNSKELASFFGFWYSSFNMAALFIQLFLTNKLLNRFRLTLNMLLLPLILVLGSILFLTFPELWVVIILKGVDTSFKQSINKASFELSIMPISYETKKQAKPFIDVVVDSIATGVSGILLIFIIEKLELDPIYIAAISIFILLIWIYLVYRLKGTYFNSFRENIKGALRKSGQDNSQNKTNSISETIEILNNGTEEEILALLKHLKHYQLDVFNPHVYKLLDHPSDKIKTASIRGVYDYKNEEAVSKIKTLALESNNDEVIFEAMEYLLCHTSEIDDSIYLGYLNNENHQIKNAALLVLAKASVANEELKVNFKLNQRIENQIKILSTDKNEHRKEDVAELLLTIGFSRNNEYYYFIEKYLSEEDSFLLKYAIKAAGFTHDEVFVEKIMSYLNHEDYHKYAVKSLQNYGEPIVQYLFKKDENEEFSAQTQSYIPEVVELFNTRQSVVVLLKLLKSKDVLVRKNASVGLKNIEDKVHKINITNQRVINVFFSECMYFRNTLSATNSLEKALVKAESNQATSEEIILRKGLLSNLQLQLDRSLETIFNLLSLKYIDTDMEIAHQGILNKTEESRINTVEFLSNILQSDLKKEFLPLLEYHFLSDSESGLTIETISENKCLLKLLNDRGVVTKKMVLQLLSFVEITPFKKKIKLLTNHKNKEISSLAIKLVES